MAGEALPERAIERLLRHAVPEDELRAMHVLTGMPWRLLPPLFGAWAMTFGRHVVFASGRYDLGSSGGLALVAHEAGHITQWRELGVARFALRYGQGLVRSRFKHGRHPMELPLIERQRAVRRALEGEADA